MTRHLHDLRQDIQSEVDTLLDFVTGEEAQSATVDHIERGLFRALLQLGAKLLLLFLSGPSIKFFDI